MTGEDLGSVLIRRGWTEAGDYDGEMWGWEPLAGRPGLDPNDLLDPLTDGDTFVVPSREGGYELHLSGETGRWRYPTPGALIADLDAIEAHNPGAERPWLRGDRR